jgi:hypothetical protein
MIEAKKKGNTSLSIVFGTLWHDMSSEMSRETCPIFHCCFGLQGGYKNAPRRWWREGS